MTTTNGSGTVARATTPTSHLGKRKRSSSPTSEHDTQPQETDQASLQQRLENALATIEQYDTSEMIASYKLPSAAGKDVTVLKRQRTTSGIPLYNTISSKISNNIYSSFEQLLEDVARVRDAVGTQVNGHADAARKSSEEIDHILGMLSEEKRGESSESSSQEEHRNGNQALQLLSLRGLTDGGVRQLFTGLPKHTSLEASDVGDDNKLPTGFEVIESALVDPSRNQIKDHRTFGTVFTSHRNLKPLETPQPSKVHGNSIDFIPPLSQLDAGTGHDFRTTKLSTSAWLRYKIAGSQQIKGELSESVNTEHKANLLFQSLFSSFAPAVDHSGSIVTESDRTNRWYQSRQRHSLPETAGKTVELVNEDQPSDVEDSIELLDDLDSMVENFISEADVDGRDEGEKLLDEISDLLLTLTSQQAIRDAEQSRGSAVTSQATTSEISTYQVLKTQLQLLIDCLPPHAVAKLDGDQLKALNVSTQVLLNKPDITGTGQADDYTIRRQRASQAANNVASRVPPNMASRPSYGTPGPVYNGPGPGYNHQVPPASTYANRMNSNNYSTPRGPVPTPTAHYSQHQQQPPQYQHRGPVSTFTTPVAQPYQQSVNAKYNPGYVQRATQPGYQQRAQDRGAAWSRPDSPSKPVINGHAQPYQNRIPMGSTVDASVQPSPLVQQRTIEQMKQQQQHVPPATPQRATANGVAP